MKTLKILLCLSLLLFVYSISFAQTNDVSIEELKRLDPTIENNSITLHSNIRIENNSSTCKVVAIVCCLKDDKEEVYAVNILGKFVFFPPYTVMVATVHFTFDEEAYNKCKEYEIQVEIVKDSEQPKNEAI